jgi:hypothetical protein
MTGMSSPSSAGLSDKTGSKALAICSNAIPSFIVDGGSTGTGAVGKRDCISWYKIAYEGLKDALHEGSLELLTIERRQTNYRSCGEVIVYCRKNRVLGTDHIVE